MTMLKYSEWENLCKTHSLEHAITAMNEENSILYFNLDTDSISQLTRLNDTLFANRPNVQLFIQPVSDMELSSNRHIYTHKELEIFSQLKHVKKMALVITAKQDKSTWPEIKSIESLFLYIGAKMDLQLLDKFPNIEFLSLQGKYEEVNSMRSLQKLKSLSISPSNRIDLSPLKEIKFKEVSISSCIEDDNLSFLFSENTEEIYISELKKPENMNFLYSAKNLRKLYLDTFSLEKLPDFTKFPRLKALQINELHKLQNIDTLINSSIEYLSVIVSADKMPAKVFAETLIEMKHLKKAMMRLMDRNDKRYDTLKNYLKKEKKLDLLIDDNIFFDI